MAGRRRTVLKSKRTGPDRVLAKYGDEFVTWARDPERPNEFYLGHYFSTREAAEDDYEQRD